MIILGQCYDLNDIIVVKYFIDLGANINNPIIVDYYATSNNIEIVKLLADTQTDFISYSASALIECAISGKLDMVRFLLSLGADVANDCSLIGLSAGRGNLTMTELLLESGIRGACYLTTALNTSAKYGDLDEIKLLIDYGADIHAGNESALQLAIIYGEFEVVKLLIDSGADIRVLSTSVINIRWNINSNNIINFVEYLVSFGLIPVIDGIIAWATVARRLDVIKYIYESGFDIHCNKLLLSSVFKCYVDLAQYAVETGADISAINEDALQHCSPYASTDEFNEMIQYLRLNGVSICNEIILNRPPEPQLASYLHVSHEHVNFMNSIRQ